MQHISNNSTVCHWLMYSREQYSSICRRTWEWKKTVGFVQLTHLETVNRAKTPPREDIISRKCEERERKNLLQMLGVKK